MAFGVFLFCLQLYIDWTWNLEEEERVTEVNFGTAGAIAIAFVCGFPPRTAV
jgi:hypothetical protein